MSAREKKLLIFFAAAGFLVLNFLAISFFNKKSLEVKTERAQALVALETAENFSSMSEQVGGEMDWLAEHLPEPAANQDVQTKLQQLCEKEAKAAGLEIKTQKPLPTDDTGAHFSRSKFQFVVSGREESLYRWFDRLNIPSEFRITSSIRLSPNKKDDYLIDCTVVIEQWFVPIPPSA